MPLDYDKDLTIDQGALDSEWLDQPRRFFRYAQQLADAKDRLTRQAERVEIEKAESDRRIRLKLIDQKVTVDMVRALIQQDPEVQKAVATMLDMEHEVGILTAAVRAFDQRKDALENLVRLHGQNYFAGPSVPREIGAGFTQKVTAQGRDEARDKAHGRRRS